MNDKLNETSPYGLNTDIPASAGPLEFVPKNMCDENPFYKEITDRKNNMSKEDIMEDFSIWLLANNWEFNYTTRIWENYENPFQYSFNDVYQLFLNQIKQKTK
jgi:hypothetical protein